MQSKTILTFVLVIAITFIVASMISHVVIGQAITSGNLDESQKKQLLKSLLSDEETRQLIVDEMMKLKSKPTG